MQLTHGLTRGHLLLPVPPLPMRGRRLLAALGGAFQRSGRVEPRGYRREGFPEHEMYLIMSGRKDRFDIY